MDAAKTPCPETRYYPDHELYPLEHELISLVASYLNSQRWPFARIPCRVVFGLKAGMASQHKLVLQGRNGRGEQVGRVELWYNLSYLHQDPTVFLSDVVPHEVAHVLTETQAAKAAPGRKAAEHGDAWKEWLSRLSAQATPKACGWRDVFDDRVSHFACGAVPYRCACAGEAGVHAVSLRRGAPAEACESCGQELKPLSREELNEPLLREADDMLKRTLDRALYGWLD